MIIFGMTNNIYVKQNNIYVDAASLKNFTKESTNEIDEKDILRFYTKDENTTVTIGSKTPSSVDFHIFPPSPISNSDSSSSYEGIISSLFLGVTLK